MRVRAKKRLGQHFLMDEDIARFIIETLPSEFDIFVLEVGSGMGALTKYLIKKKNIDLTCVEVDKEANDYLKQHYPNLNIINFDFLKLDLSELFDGNEIYLIGNFPYNISNLIFFKLLENKDRIVQCSGMVQKEVAERITSTHGKKTYGILSVLLQTYYDIHYLKTVSPTCFIPIPKVESAVIILKRNKRFSLPCNEIFYKNVVKTAFNQRRKQLRNSLKKIVCHDSLYLNNPLFSLRPEQLTVDDFIELTCKLEKNV